jgi:hypothetical protein
VAAVGAVAWITATTAAAVAYRRVGAPALVSVLLGLSLVVCAHPAPVEPVGIVCFAAAVGLLCLRQRRATAAEFSGRERTRAAQV